MRLLYCYTEFLDKNGNPHQFRGLDTIEVNFSATDVFSYDKNTNTLTRTARKHPLPENFWTNGSGNTNIYNVNVIAGQNGSGKTTVMNYIVDLLNYIYHGIGTELNDSDRRTRYDPSNNHNILGFEDDEEMLLLDLVPNIKLTTVHHVSVDGFAVQPQIIYRRVGERFAVNYQRLKDSVVKTKVIYMTNTLNQRDYELELVTRTERRRDPFVYDCTIGAAIGNDISSFFLLEVFKQVKFVFDPRYSALHRLPDSILRLPKALSIRPRLDSFIEYYEVTLSKTDKDLEMLALTEQLGRLCSAAYAENIGLLTDRKLYPEIRKQFWGNVINLNNPVDQVKATTKMSKAIAVSGSVDHTIRVWDVFTGKCIRILEGHTGAINSVLIHNTRCVCGSMDGKIGVWDINSGEILETLKGQIPICLAVTNEDWLIYGSADSLLRICDLYTGERTKLLEGHSDLVRCVAWTDDGLCISGSDDKTLRVWNIRTGDCLRLMEGHTDSVQCVAVTVGRKCLSGSRDKTLRMWDIDTGKCQRIMDDHTGSVNCVAVTKDGKYAVSGSSDKTLRVWEIQTGECVHLLEGHTGSVNSVTVTKDGLCISGSDDNTLRVWDIITGHCLRIMEGHVGAVSCVTTQIQNDSDEVKELEQKCLSYLQFIEDNRTKLFSRFNDIGSNVYELPIERDSNDNETYQLLCEFINKYRDTCRPHYTLDFDWGLSSGEENMLRIFTWLHHIFPLDVTDGKCVIRNRESGSNDTICDSILLFMDEADLTLHPEWQREFINVLTTYIPILYPTAVAKDIQLVLSTHSPLLLGDIPSENVVYLKSDGQSEKSFEISTFGQNIHTILKDSFFLSNGVGEFAKGKINNTAQKLRDKIIGKEDVSPQELAECKAVIDLVSPGVIKSKLLELYDEATGGSDRSVKIVQGYIDTMSTEQLEAMADAFQAEIERRKK